VSINLMIGVGRTQTTIDKFEFFLFTQAGAFSPEYKYSTEVIAPPRNSTFPAPPAGSTFQNVVDHVVAQDIQVQFQLFLNSVLVGEQMEVEVGAFFAPNVHVRPEWTAKVGVFPGREASGR
jgi:hypothetical protein